MGYCRSGAEATCTTAAAKMNSSAAEMSAATSATEVRATTSAAAVATTATTAAVAATASARGHRIDRAGERHHRCQQHCTEPNWIFCHDLIPPGSLKRVAHGPMMRSRPPPQRATGKIGSIATIPTDIEPDNPAFEDEFLGKACREALADRGPDPRSKPRDRTIVSNI